jgi:hypothetical protein
LRGTDPEPEVHQVVELPKIEPLVTECRGCGRSTRGQLPEGTPRGAFGPRVVAMITELVGVYGVSRRDAQDMLRDMFSLPMSLGAVIGCQKLGASALAPAHAEALAEVPRAKDRYSVYDFWQAHRHQFCWAHLSRLFVKFSERTDPERVNANETAGTRKL